MYYGLSRAGPFEYGPWPIKFVIDRLMTATLFWLPSSPFAECSRFGTSTLQDVMLLRAYLRPAPFLFDLSRILCRISATSRFSTSPSTSTPPAPQTGRSPSPQTSQPISTPRPRSPCLPLYPPPSLSRSLVPARVVFLRSRLAPCLAETRLCTPPFFLHKYIHTVPVVRRRRCCLQRRPRHPLTG